jgi:hypothetical protein
MSEEKELQRDTVRLLRAVMKISSALNDYDTIVYEKRYFKYNFKRVSTTWAKAMFIHTAFLMKELAKEDEKLLAEVYTSLDEASKGITAGDESRTALILMYAKLKSALADIDSMEDSRNTFYPMFLHEHTQRVINQANKQYLKLIEIVDKDGNDINHLINFYNDLGVKLMHYSKDGEQSGDTTVGVLDSQE